MKQRQFAVIGLGVFGMSIARVLAQHDVQVLAIDLEEKRVEEIAPIVTQAVVADATDDSALKSLGLADVDVAIVSIGEDLEASILISLHLKDIGVKTIVAKALNEMHARVLAKIGVDRVVIPERDMASKLVEGLLSPNILDEIEVSPDYSLVEIVAPKVFVGKTLGDLGLRANYGVNIVGIRRKVPFLTDSGDTDFKEDTNISPEATDEIMDGDILVVVGRDDSLDKFKEI